MSQEAWIAAFAAAQEEFPPIGKETEVSIKTDKGTYTYAYATLPDILSIVSPVLRKHDLVLTQSVAGTADTISVETRIYHKEGHVEMFGPLSLTSGRDPKAAGSAITYARRYALCAALGIAPDEDDDGAKASEQSKLTREDPPFDAAAWLATAVEQFGLWTPEERKKVGAEVVAELKPGKPMTREEAEAVNRAMADRYHAEFPEAGLF